MRASVETGEKKSRGGVSRGAPSGTKIDPKKLLPPAGGAIVPASGQQGTAGAEDTSAEVGDVKKSVEDLKSVLTSGFSKIENNLQSMVDALSKGNQVTKKGQEKARISEEKGRKAGREASLETKEEKPETMAEKATKPVMGFFEMILNFFKNVLMGTVVVGLLKLLTNPKKFLDPIFKVINGVISALNWLIALVVDAFRNPINLLITGLNAGIGFIVDMLNKALKIIPGVKEDLIPKPQLPEIPAVPAIPKIPLQEESAPPVQAAMGGGVVQRMDGGGKAQTLSDELGHTRGTVTDPKERQEQEAYMLKMVNEERALQGLEPLKNLTYAPGVYLTKARGPGPKTREESHTKMDFDRGVKHITTSKSVDGEITEFGGGTSQITEEERKKFFAENPMAAQFVKMRDQAELDALGMDISAMAKMKGGGIVQRMKGGGSVVNNTTTNTTTNNVQRMKGGGSVNNTTTNTTTNNVGGKTVSADKISAAEGGPVKSNSGVTVTGMGPDTQLVAAQPGEIVMSKKAVDKIGADKLLAMNKDAGGTNKPTVDRVDGVKVSRLKGGGAVAQVGKNSPRSRDIGTPFKSKTNVRVIPIVPKQSPQGASSSGSSADQKQVNSFNASDVNNFDLNVVKSIYNIVG